MIELIRQGGWVMGLLVAMSAVGLIIFFERYLHYHRAQIRPVDFLEGIFNVLRRGNLVEAVTLCEETPGPVARVVRAALLHRDASREDQRRAIEEAGMIEMARLERRLRVLAVLSRLGPLMGLLGTVLGLGRAFLIIEHNAPLVHIGDLSGALHAAILCTAGGLGVAIPAYAAYHWLVGRVESIALDMEFAAAEILTHLSRPVRGTSAPEVKP